MCGWLLTGSSVDHVLHLRKSGLCESDEVSAQLRCYAYFPSHEDFVAHLDATSLYVIVDGDRVASGSYNFSNNAEHDTFENLIFFEGGGYEEVIADFVANFEAIWDTGLDGSYGALMTQITDTGDDFPIVFDSMALAWPEVSALKAAILANCPDINTSEYRTQPQSHQTCER